MKMNKTLLGGLATVALMAVSASSAFAVSTVALSPGNYQSGIGGEFTATVSDGSLSAYTTSYSSLVTGIASASNTNTFQTFCIEYNEHFSYGSAYDYQISSAAIMGGTSTQDPVSVGTGWLYSQFAKGTLAGYNYSGTQAVRQLSAAALQNAIWWLEGEISTDQSSNSFITTAQAALGIASTVPNPSPGQGGTGLALNSYNGNTAATYGVYALNLGPFSGQTRSTQDQLIYKTTANTDVPDGGATILMLGMAIAGVGAARRYLH